jgi:protein TonB
MTQLDLGWLEDGHSPDLTRWASAAGIVAFVHAAVIAGFLLWHQPADEIGDASSVVTVELAPIDSVADAHQRDVAQGPEDMIEQKAVPLAEKQPDQPKLDESPPPPAVTMPDVALPEQKPPEKAEEERPPSPQTTARVQGGAPRVEPTWQTVLLKRLQQYKHYPQSAQVGGEQGVVLLGFSVDRNGRVLEHRIVQSSGHPDLDNVVMAMIERAQPLPAFPASMTQSKLDLTVPIRFSLH